MANGKHSWNIFKNNSTHYLNQVPDAAGIRTRLDGLVSVYPFNEYEFIISHLLASDVLSLDDYYELYGEILEPLKDQALFRQFSVHPEFHTLFWPNGADFAPEFLHDRVRILA